MSVNRKALVWLMTKEHCPHPFTLNPHEECTDAQWQSALDKLRDQSRFPEITGIVRVAEKIDA